MNAKLYRSRIVRIFGGVAGGLAEYLKIDPVIVRVLFVISAFLNGIGLILYIILWIIVPEAPVIFPGQNNDATEDSSEKNEADYNIPFPQEPVKKSGRGRIVVGIILISLGILFFAKQLFPFWHISDLLPLALIALGAILVWNSVRKQNEQN